MQKLVPQIDPKTDRLAAEYANIMFIQIHLMPSFFALTFFVIH